VILYVFDEEQINFETRIPLEAIKAILEILNERG